MKKILNFIKKNYLLFIIAFCLIIVIALVEDIFEQEVIYCDIITRDFFVKTIRSNNLTNLMKIITNFGSAFFLIGMSSLSFVLLKNKRKAVCIVSNLAIIAFLNHMFKIIIQRPRPNGYNLIVENGYSFPSGHSMVSMAFYGFIIYLVIKFIKDKKLKVIISILLLLLIIFIGISRIYLGVHYASDVIAGFLLSIIYLIIFIKATKRFIVNV